MTRMEMLEEIKKDFPVFDDDGKFISRTTRELTNNEREENLDILWRY